MYINYECALTNENPASIGFGIEAFGAQLPDDAVEHLLAMFVEGEGGSLAVEGVDDDAFGADATDTGEPLRPGGILRVVEGTTVVFPAEKERLDDEVAVEGAEFVGDLLDIHRHDGRVDDVEHLLGARVELEHRVFDALQGAHNLRTEELRGVRKAGDDGLRGSSTVSAAQ